MEKNIYFNSIDDFADIFSNYYNEQDKRYKPSKLDVIKVIKLSENEKEKNIKYSINNNGKKEKKTIKLHIPQEVSIDSSIVIVGEGNVKKDEIGSLVVQFR